MLLQEKDEEEDEEGITESRLALSLSHLNFEWQETEKNHS